MLIKRDWYILLALVLLTIVVRLPSLIEPLDNDGGAIAYHARQIIRGNPLYSSHHPDHQLPGVFYTAALAFKLLGDNQLSLKIFILPFIIACAWLIFTMGRTIHSGLTGLVGAVFYILVSSQVLLTGTMVKIEPFANFPLTAGTLTTIMLLRKNAPARRFFWLGVLGAICILYKPIFITPMALAGIGILATAWLDRKQSNALKTVLHRLFWMLAGLSVPLMLTAFYFAALGLWDRLLLVFNLGVDWINNTDNMSASELPRPFGFPLFWMGVNNIALLLLGLFGLYRHIRRAFPIKGNGNVTNLILAFWMIISFALAGLRGGGYPYYVLLVVPSLAFMGASEIDYFHKKWKNDTGLKYNRLGSGTLAMLVIINFAWINLDLYRNYGAYETGQITLKDFLYGYKGTGARSWNAELIAEYIAERTTPDDLIYVWSTDIQIYYFADRRWPIDIPWPVYVSATGPPERVFTPQTKYIVIDSPERLVRPDWLLKGLARSYSLEAVIGEKEIYRLHSP